MPAPVALVIECVLPFLSILVLWPRALPSAIAPPGPLKPLTKVLGTAYASSLSPSAVAGLMLRRAGTFLPLLGVAQSTSDIGTLFSVTYLTSSGGTYSVTFYTSFFS